MSDDEVDPADVEELMAMVAAPPEGTDLAEVTGLLGVAFLQLYDQEADLDTLAAGIGHLHDALALDSGHPDRVMWLGYLGLGYGERARRTDHIEHHDAAVMWTAAALDELPLDDPDHDGLSVTLAEQSWDRFYARRSGTGAGALTARTEVEALVARLEPLTAADPEASNYLQMLLGMGYLERFQVTEAAHDLDRGITVLEAALPALPVDTPRRNAADMELVNACRLRFEHTGDRESLDRAVAAAADLIGASNPDQPEWVMLHWLQAQAYESRWNGAVKDPADLDRAIECWHVVWDGDGDGDGAAAAALSCGILLCERAHLITPPAPADLAGAAQAMERALASGELDSELEVLLSLHGYRLMIMLAQSSQPELAPSADRQKQLVEQGRAMLARAATAPVADRAILAGLLALGEFAVAHAELERFDRGHGGLALAGLSERASELLTLASQLPDPWPEWQAVLDCGWGVLEASAPGAAGGPDVAAERFARAAELLGTDLLGPRLQALMAMLAYRHSSDTGDKRGAQAAVRRISQAAAVEGDPDMLVCGALMSALYSAQHGDRATFHTEMDKLLAAVGDQPASRLSDLSMVPMVQFARGLSAVFEKLPFEADLAGPASPDAGGLPPSQQLMLQCLSCLGRMADAVSRDDLSRLRECAAAVDELAGGPMPDDNGQPLGVPVDILRLLASTMAGLAHLTLARRDRSSRLAAERAVHWYEQAIALLGGHHHPLWAMVAASMGESLRLAGSPDRAHIRQLGMSALQGHAWQVLRQAGTDHAIDATRNTATVDTYRLARWCMEDGATEEMVAVLDASRGLVLNTATASRDIAHQLTELGHFDLARQWRATAGLGLDRLTGARLSAGGDEQIPDDLRLRVLQVLQPEVLEPIRIDHIQTSLANLNADALVYLLPDQHGPGTAVVVPVSGPIDTIELPDLTVGTDSPVSHYAGAIGGARDAGPAGPGRGRSRLEEVCAWAWQAAVGPLIAYVQRWQLHRASRLVLVPMGMLGLVPWHAAVTSRGTGRRYAIEDLIVSYSPSARVMCQAAARPHQSIRSALVVGDPTGDLTGAGVEARAIHRRFHPDGAYFGRPAGDCEGTPEEVLGWIENAAPGPSLLHFACHGRVDADRPADAHLVLAHGRQLAARDLLETSRLAALEIDTVYLAACTTHVSGKDYDEVMSLATAFLAAGARTVLGSLWPVPDDATSLLMYLVHHHVNVDQCAPAEALHRAQLWMLDPGRQPPDGMPEELVRRCSRPDVADPVSWAGFTHLGR